MLFSHMEGDVSGECVSFTGLRALLHHLQLLITESTLSLCTSIFFSINKQHTLHDLQHMTYYHVVISRQ
jgi:hypothetical protein